MSRILSRISMFTGQISSQALHDVQAQISSGLIRSNTESAETFSSGSWPTTGDTVPLGDVAAMTCPTLSTISRGSRGLPVAWAGQTLVHRPQTVHASVSRSCFHVKSSIALAPNDSSEVSVRFGIGFMAPLGRSRADRYMFNGEVNMCRSLVVGTRITKAKKAATCKVHDHWWAMEIWCLERLFTADESGYPSTRHFSNVGLPW